MITRQQIDRIGIPGLLAAAIIWLGAELRTEKADRKAAEERVISLQQTYHGLVTTMLKVEE